MRFTAPKHASSFDLTSGNYPVVDGIVEIPDDLSPGEISGLIANGCVLEHVEPEPEPEVLELDAGVTAPVDKSKKIDKPVTDGPAA